MNSSNLISFVLDSAHFFISDHLERSKELKVEFKIKLV